MTAKGKQVLKTIMAAISREIETLSDADYIEVCDEIADDMEMRAVAKKEDGA